MFSIRSLIILCLGVLELYYLYLIIFEPFELNERIFLIGLMVLCSWLMKIASQVGKERY